ncbi:MAG: DUF4249 domain-containing protein [Prevotellaceae bacterium]|jgi:hypothetical protein|nr:DUF4249 domain-containing protein [Prevotellaceae bacterium]
MKNKLFTYIFTAIALLFLTSCVEPIEIETSDSPPVIVIYGIFTDEMKHHSVMISSSSPYFDNQPNQVISGAEVQIESSAHDIYAFAEVDSIPGQYNTVNEVAGINGMSYTLKVSVDFNNDGTKELYTAASFMHQSVDIDSIKIRSANLMGRKRYIMYLYAQDSPSEDYYLSRFKVNDILVRDSISRLSLLNDNIFNGQYMNGIPLETFRDATDTSNDDEDDDDNDRRRLSLNVDDTVGILFSRIEEGYYRFINQCRNEMRGESSFFGTPASNIVSNISNGGVGYFACYSVTESKTVVKK